MALADIELSLFAFPQRWNAGAIDFRVLLIPTGNPTLASGSGLPAFAGADWTLTATVQPGLDSLLGPKLPTTPTPLNQSFNAKAPPGSLPLWQALGARFNPAPPDTAANRLSRLSTTSVLKELPPSYRQAAAFSRSSIYNTTGNEFGCALREAVPAQPTDPKPAPTVTWGGVLSFALRQPLLARALGLIYDFQFTLAPANALLTGGWLYVQLAPTSSAGVNPAALRSYAARLPALDPAPAKARGLFAPVLFPVGVSSAGNYDTPLAEAALFDDGFAKIVHGAQALTADAASSGHSKLDPATDAGLDVGWDDEQVTLWFNRQIDGLRARLDPTVVATESPLGVSGYRLDVRVIDGVAGHPWQSLCSAFSADAKGKPIPLIFPASAGALAFSAKFDGELTVEPAPVRALHADDQAAWLPRYFARWQGGSLVVNDDTLFQLTGATPNDANGNPLKPAVSNYVAHLPAIGLRYGTRYEVRCRYADLTGGGPEVTDEPSNPSPSPSAAISFLRHVAPKALQLSTDVEAVAAGEATPAISTINEIDFWRPLIGYPELKFTGFDSSDVIEKLIQNAPAARAAGSAVGVYDPDVTHVRLTVQVKLAAHDSGPGDVDEGNFYTLYETDLPFPAYNVKDPFAPGAPLSVALEYVDVADISMLAAPTAEVSTLPIPTSREIRIRGRAVCADKPEYFGSDAARLGLVADISTRAPAKEEQNLFAPMEEAVALNAILLQPGSDFAQRVASQLNLAVDGLKFSAHPGERVIFGASAKLRTSLAGDGSAITFASNADFFGHWLVGTQVVLARDWTWNGLTTTGLEVSRRDDDSGTWAPVGNVSVPFVVAPNAIGADTGQRAQTRLIFFDAVDANPSAALGSFPQLLTPEWLVRPLLVDQADPVDDALSLQYQLRLPVAVAPVQTPKLVSAGIALSPYVRGENYASTESRQRVLWFEFAEPILDPNDKLFARVLSYGPDPLLAGSITHQLAPVSGSAGNISALDIVRSRLPNPPPPAPLAIDPELIRVVVPGQAEDSSGLGAMIEMTPCSPPADGSPARHFIVPLPPALALDDPKLFGFWTYELRIGHKAIWSTAQARFGRPLVVNGVQHPPPTLRCTPSRIKEKPVITISGNFPKSRITVAAPYATPVFADKNLFDPTEGDPRTQIWVLLYAQVTQADGGSYRNILLGRAPAVPQFRMINGVRFRPPTRDCPGVATFDEATVQNKLAAFALPADSALSVIAVEMLPGGDLTEDVFRNDSLTFYSTNDVPLVESSSLGGRGFGSDDPNAIVSDPLGADLAAPVSRRILRCSPLTAVPDAC